MKDMLKYNTSIKILGRSRKNQQIQGTTLAEALVAIVIVGVLAAIAAPSVFSQGSKPLPDTVNQVAGILKSARAMAIAQTSPIKVRPLGNVLDTAGKSNGGSSNRQLEILRATSTNAVCNSETGWTVDRTLTSDYLKFGNGIALGVATINGITTKNTVNPTQPPDATAWQVCFNTRGVASITSASTMNFQGDDVILTLQQASPSKTQTLEIFPSGGIQVNDD